MTRAIFFGACLAACLGAGGCSGGKPSTEGAAGTGAAGTGGGGKGGGAGASGSGGAIGGKGGAIADAGVDRVCGTPARHYTFTPTLIHDLGAVDRGAEVVIRNDGAPIFIFNGGPAGQTHLWAAGVPEADDGGVTGSVAFRLSREGGSGITVWTDGYRVRQTKSGDIRVAYIEQRIRYSVRYVEWNGDFNTDPTDTTIGADDIIPPGVAFALDAQDHPAVTYYGNDFSLWFATNTGNGWRSEMVAPTSTTRVALVFDQANPVLLAYGVWINMANGLYALTRGASAWDAALLETNVGYAHAEHDRSGQINIWYDLDTASRHAIGSPGAWRFDGPVPNGRGRTVAYGPGGELHMLLGGGDGLLQYAYYDGCAWSYQVVDPDTARRTPAGIAVDANGTPHIAYQSTNRDAKPATPNELWYARPSVQ